MRGYGRAVAALLALTCASGCYGIRVAAHEAKRPEYRSLARPNVARDDLDIAGLRRAALASRRYFNRARTPANYAIGGDVYSKDQIAHSVDHFVRILDETPPRLLHQRIARECRGYSPSQGAKYTAYYEPVLQARLQPDARFKYPLYTKPDAATLATLARTLPAVRPGGSRVTRADIDGRGVLAGRGLELAYLDDPVALYFLHVQGSGRLRLPDGRVMRVNYGGDNGMPYASIGRQMIDQGLITGGSSMTISSYLRTASPGARNAVLFQNPRYIFFRQVELADADGPVGSLGVPLVAGRSIAADARYVPPGAVVYVKTKAPVLDTRGKLVGWNDMARFTFNHDSGSAIKGPGRADIYWGEGDRAGMAAGYVNGPGEMVVLMCGADPQPTVARGPAGMVNVAWPEVARALAAVTTP